MKVLDQSATQVAKPEVYVHNGKVEYKLNFGCAHETVEVMHGEVICHDCNNLELTPEQAESILESYLDLKASEEEDREQQR